MPRYRQVNWEKAACAGAPTNLFFIVEENRKVLEWINIDVLRKICLACPIWKECTSYAFAHENDGVWGGLTSNERKALTKGEPSTIADKAKQELARFGISNKQLQEVIDEHTSYDGSLENEASH